MMHVSLFITIYILCIAVLLGAAFGSFLDCMAWRIAAGESILKGRSHCDNCQHVLGFLDLIPVFSYVFLKGRCRYCGKKVSPESTCCEILLGLIFAVLVYRFDVSFRTLRFLILAGILLGLSLVDLKTYTIPNGFIAAGILSWFMTLPGILYEEYGESLREGMLHEALYPFLGALMLGGSMLLLSLLFDHILGKESMGGGDIKLFFMTGLYLHPLLLLFYLILSSIIGLLFALLFKQRQIPFGPAISIAALTMILWGNGFLNWYIGLL